MNNFFSYKIFSQPFNSDLLSGLMWDFDITGLLEDEDHITIFVPGNSATKEAHILSALKKMQDGNLIESFRIEKELIEDKNWNELWEKSREVIRVSDKIVIKPTFKDYTAKANEIVLTIDPKMSFGTGEHQTTKLILKLLENYVTKRMKVLDVGSGTGILAIAAVKLGALRAVAVDFDEICLENCKENCILNGLENLIEVITGEINDIDRNDFDLILANIQRSVLLEIADKIKSRINKKAVLILSGLLESDQVAIEKKYHSLGFKTSRIEKMDEWIAIVLTL